MDMGAGHRQRNRIRDPVCFRNGHRIVDPASPVVDHLASTWWSPLRGRDRLSGSSRTQFGSPLVG